MKNIIFSKLKLFLKKNDSKNNSSTNEIESENNSSPHSIKSNTTTPSSDSNCSDDTSESYLFITNDKQSRQPRQSNLSFRRNVKKLKLDYYFLYDRVLKELLWRFVLYQIENYKSKHFLLIDSIKNNAKFNKRGYVVVTNKQILKSLIKKEKQRLEILKKFKEIAITVNKEWIEFLKNLLIKFMGSVVLFKILINIRG